jgi:hypothetical protein
MSKITELKKQYPELNISIFDLFSKIDGTKTNKYLPLICNLLSHRFQPYKMWNKRDADSESKHITERVESFGINCEDMSINEIYMIYTLSDYFQYEDMRLLSSFRKYNERNLIPNKDVTSYKNFDDIRAAVGLASLKEDEKEMRTQIFKEYEDDKWLALRPLTFGASSKYGSATKWCTTYQNDKQYFERYWKRGVLVYFINKVTGLKFAVFKSLDDEKELSFWNSADSRVDFLELDIEDYMISIVKNIIKSDKTNKDLCTTKIKRQVEMECNSSIYKKQLFEVRDEPITGGVLEEINDMVDNELDNLHAITVDDALNNRIERLRESLGIPSQSRVEIMERPQYEIREEGVVQFNPNR